jgi:hypothetical protein
VSDAVSCRIAETRTDLVVVLIALPRDGSFFDAAVPSLPVWSFRRVESAFAREGVTLAGRSEAALWTEALNFSEGASGTGTSWPA